MKPLKWILMTGGLLTLVLGLTPVVQVAIPAVAHARTPRDTLRCVAELKQIDSAKEQFREDHHLGYGAPVQWKHLVPDYLKRVPHCPLGGTYCIAPVGELPTCSFGGRGHALERIRAE